MAKNVIWSEPATETFHCTLLYYIRITGNNAFATRLVRKIEQTVARIADFPLMGTVTDYANVRAFSEGHNKIIYEIRENEIVILMIWDTRQNPDDLQLEKFLR
jgi:toxin YoeB